MEKGKVSFKPWFPWGVRVWNLLKDFAISLLPDALGRGHKNLHKHGSFPSAPPRVNQMQSILANPPVNTQSAPTSFVERVVEEQMFRCCLCSLVTRDTFDIVSHIVMPPLEHVFLLMRSTSTIHTKTLIFIVALDFQIQPKALSALMFLK